jgi:hypothetical protein
VPSAEARNPSAPTSRQPPATAASTGSQVGDRAREVGGIVVTYHDA